MHGILSLLCTLYGELTKELMPSDVLDRLLESPFGCLDGLVNEKRKAPLFPCLLIETEGAFFDLPKLGKDTEQVIHRPSQGDITYIDLPRREVLRRLS
jgi:hypothetical protein